MHRLRRLLPVWLVPAGYGFAHASFEDSRLHRLKGPPSLSILRYTLLPAVSPCQRQVSKQLSAESAFGSMAGAEASMPGTPLLSVLLEGS